MSFWEKFEQVCAVNHVKPQSKELLDTLQAKSGTVTGWKQGAKPSIDAVCAIANHFDVTTDFLLDCDTCTVDEARELRRIALHHDFRSIRPESTDEELILNLYRNAAIEGKFRIIAACVAESKEK